MIPKNLIKLFLIAFLSSFLFAVETTSNFKGDVTDLSGNALEDAEITITIIQQIDLVLLLRMKLVFLFLTNLPVGGPYTVLVDPQAGSQRFIKMFS